MEPFPPPPVVELTLEQQFKLRRIEDLATQIDKQDLLDLYMQLQKQNFILSNNLSNLIKQWPTTPP
jgi:hypothetical protein